LNIDPKVLPQPVNNSRNKPKKSNFILPPQETLPTGQGHYGASQSIVTVVYPGAICTASQLSSMNYCHT